MPISEEKRKKLNTTFVTMSVDTPWLYLVVLVRNLPIIIRRDWYALIELEQNQWAVEPIRELLAAQPALKTATLKQLSLPNKLQPAITVDADRLGWGMAQKRMHQSPYRRLVVMANNQVIGLLCDDKKRNSPYTATLQAFFDQQPPQADEVLYICPECKKRFVLNTGADKKDVVHPHCYVICPYCKAQGPLDMRVQIQPIQQSMLTEAWEYISQG